MRTAVWLICLVLMVASCASPQPRPGTPPPEKEEPRPEAPADLDEPVPEPVHVVHAFLDALRYDQPVAAWELLTERARRESGFTPVNFEKDPFPTLRKQWLDWTRYSIHAEEKFGAVAIVAMVHGRGKDLAVRTLGLREERSGWMIDLFGPVVTPLQAPDTGSGPLAHRVKAAVEGSTVLTVITMLDGEMLSRRSGAGKSEVTIRADPPGRLAPGPHIVVVLAVDSNGRVGTGGWVFHTEDDR